MYERIKLLRNNLKLNQSDFGKRLGLSRDTIANIEGNRIDIKDFFILSICREFNVNEDWLRYGNGEMFNTLENLPLDEIISNSTIDNLEIDILKAYFSIDKDIRKTLIEHFKKSLQN